MQNTKLTFGGFNLSNMNSMLMNVDSYKVGMYKQYPKGTQQVYSYIESRGGQHDEVVTFGLQMFIQEYLSTPFTEEDIEFANVYWTAHGEDFPYETIKEMYKVYKGYWPVTIRAVPEGTVVNTKNVLAVVFNTDERFALAVTWLETAMLRAVWYGSTVATNAREIRKVIKQYLEKSGDVSGLPFKLHDFGARGVSSFESAGIGGLANLVTGMGTDTMTANLYAMKYYSATGTVGFSINASEHSTITSWGRENEKQAYQNMIDQFAKPGAIFACVSDSYNIYKACHMWGELSVQIKQKEATLVVRPDSGDPLEVIPKCMNILGNYFGYTENEKGYKVLNNCRMLWGDGITAQTISSILRVLVDLYGWSADNFAFGQGGAMLQIVNRDDQKFAMKCSAVMNSDNEWVDVFKDPITDSGKVSKKGRVTLFSDNSGGFFTDLVNGNFDALQTVYCDGVIMNQSTFEEVRELAKI